MKSHCDINPLWFRATGLMRHPQPKFLQKGGYDREKAKQLENWEQLNKIKELWGIPLQTWFWKDSYLDMSTGKLGSVFLFCVYVRALSLSLALALFLLQTWLFQTVHLCLYMHTWISRICVCVCVCVCFLVLWLIWRNVWQCMLSAKKYECHF